MSRRVPVSRPWWRAKDSASPEDGGSKDRCLPAARWRVGSTRASRPRRTTDQICGHRRMRV